MLRVAFVLPFGEASEGFLPDSLLSLLCAEARRLGHRADLVRVYYDGRNEDRDREVAERLRRWLAEREADLVVFERLFDPLPLLAHLQDAPGRRSLLVTRGDSFDPIEGVDLVIGATFPSSRGEALRRTPALGELCRAFTELLDALSRGTDPAKVPGLARVEGGALRLTEPPVPAPLPRPFRPALDHDVIALGDPPRVVQKTLFGNVGCPYSADPLNTPHFAGVRLPATKLVARLGCSFCCMGGDYQKRADAEVVAELVEQADFFSRNAPDVQEFVLNDQHALRYLAALIREARAAGIRPVRWLFAARADAFVREHERITAAIAEIADSQHVLEVYLSGFEAFCDRELDRYNKGVKVAELLEAIAVMRRLAREHPGRFEYARARGHSLILWNPWTSPEDLEQSVSTIRRHGLTELFDELGRNRLRLHQDLPIHWAAERDGALLDDWQQDDEGAGRRKGYNPERPWRFLDPRTHLAHALAEALREKLGTETEAAQLAAIVDYVRSAPAGRSVDEVREEVLAALALLDDAISALSARERAPDAPARGGKQRAAAARFGGACNNDCLACANRDRWFDDDQAAVIARVDAARASGRPVLLAGREPTLHPGFLRAVARSRGYDARAVGVVSNGRRFHYAEFARRSIAVGLTSASVKVFAPDAPSADAISRAPGGLEQALSGMRNLRAAGIAAIELMAPLHATNLAQFERFAPLAAEAGADHIRIEGALDAVGLDRLAAAAQAVQRLAARCRAEGIPLEASTLRAGTASFEWLAAPRPARGA